MMRGFATAAAGGKDIHGFWQKDNYPGAIGHYYQAGIMTIWSRDDLVPTADKLYAFPIFFPVDTLVAKLHIGVSGARAGSLTRLGIYDSITGTAGPTGANTYPNKLLYDGGDLATSVGAGVVTCSPNYTFTKNTLYYLTSLWFNAGAGVATVRGNADWTSWSMLGETTDASGSDKAAWQADFAYAALPATFPTAGSTALYVAWSMAPYFSFV